MINRFSLTVTSKLIFTFLLVLVSHYALATEPVQLEVRIVSKIPHPLPAYTQGLAIDEDVLCESAGLYGQSKLRFLDIHTGKELHSQPIEKKFFAEGLAVFPDEIAVITWRENQALIFEKSGQRVKHVLFYSGEGWGLCRDENSVWMSNGTSTLTQRDKKTFTPLRTIEVRKSGIPVEHINDLECVGDLIYANVWMTDEIIQIDKKSGEVIGIINAASLLSPIERKKLQMGEVLNGIAYREKTRTFFITGKEWPWIFEVDFVPSRGP